MVDQTFEGRRLLAGGTDADRRSAAVIPVLDALSGLLPEGLRRGETVSLAGSDRSGDQNRGLNQGRDRDRDRDQGRDRDRDQDRGWGRDRGQDRDWDRPPTYLALALLAGALRAGLWCAAVGVPSLGGLALADLLGRGPERRDGLARLLVAPEPGERWAQVTAALADGVDLLLVRPPGQVPAQLARRIDARLRQSRSGGGTRHSAALLVLGAWPGARLELRTARMAWTGLSGVGPTAGTGHLTGGQATVVAAGRATGGRARTVRLWLPTATGAAAPLIDTPLTGTPPTGTPLIDTPLTGTPLTSTDAPPVTADDNDAASSSRRLSIVA